MNNQAIDEMDIEETRDLINIKERSSMTSTLSGETDFRSQRTTQSTRDKLSQLEAELSKLRLEVEKLR